MHSNHTLGFSLLQLVHGSVFVKINRDLLGRVGMPVDVGEAET